ncbi:MAG: M81 family metallopeptidase [Chlorobi bacterium]|nr:M81 family metallopeptidase [Chlorobiota bacterium]
MKTVVKILLFFLFPLFLFTSCQQADQGKKDKMRVGVIRFSHETCTFCPRETGIKEWEYYGPPMQGKDVLSAGPYMRGFVDFCRETGGFILTGIYSPREAQGGSSGSWITREAFDKYTHGMQKDLQEQGPFDALYLSLHGAMAVKGILKPEAEIVRRLRTVVGDIPIFITLDLHANEDHELSDVADAVFIVKRYPHYDSYLQGERAAWVLYRTLKGTYKPVMATRKPGVITPSVFQWTGEAPAMEIMERARRWECRRKDVFVSVAFGFAYADVPDAGATLLPIMILRWPIPSPMI